ncbi:MULTISPECIES: hypothetical protein [unclassified Gordonia (in: high G+C Gram-positive bacteria)]|uniref:hypothetical protein n=1 Tax=unclassified Gordonia (in: high G+C Gram-positive bacteria) TaxID=2657482 RepID=UPI001F0646D5|nr:hypothetical protein [Gordonia sp. PDNC005]
MAASAGDRVDRTELRRERGDYLGFCLGAYLATAQYGFGVFGGTARRHANAPGSLITTLGATIADVDWRGVRRPMFFQDGPQFTAPSGADIIARYPGGAAAALVSSYGSGRVGLVGPHPEATKSWFPAGASIDSRAVDPSAAYDLIASTHRR